MKKIALPLIIISLLVIFTATTIPAAQAQITNPATGSFGEYSAETTSGTQFVNYFVNIWIALTLVGGLAVILFMLWGAFDWITAGGDSGKITKARDKMTQSVIGLIILVSSFVIIGFVGRLFFGDEFDILRLNLPGTVAPRSPGPGSGGNGGSIPNSPNDPKTVLAGQCVPQEFVLSYTCTSGESYAYSSCESGLRCKTFATDTECFDSATQVCVGRLSRNNARRCSVCVPN